MKAILFSGLSMMDKREVRESLIRIPEVISRIKQAQKTVDELAQTNVELINTMLDEDIHFFANSRVRRVLVNLVHVGLYDRYIKKYPKPQYYVGSIANLSAIEHCMGMSFMEEFVRSVWFQDFEKLDNVDFLRVQDMRQLHQMAKKNLPYFTYEVNQITPDMFESKKIEEGDSSAKLIDSLINKMEIKQFVNLGPEDILIDPFNNPFFLEDISVYNTIEVDPMLSWFIRERAVS